MNERVKIGIVGAGVFGSYHAAKCGAHPLAELVGVYDHKLPKAAKLAKTYNIKTYFQYKDMLPDIDAIIIASPGLTHGAYAISALQAGLHCLIEKPIAADRTEALEILNLAKATGLTVQIGHQERFVAKAMGLDKIPETPVLITAFRMTPYSLRGKDVSVTLDLMTHDLDLLTLIIGERPEAVKGYSSMVRSKTEDASLGFLQFPSGTKATLHASRVEDVGRRTMDIKYPSGTVSIDFNAKTLRHDTPFDLDENFTDNPMAQDSLGAATNAFIEAVLNDKPISVTAQDGYKALEMALTIDGDITWDAKTPIQADTSGG